MNKNGKDWLNLWQTGLEHHRWNGMFVVSSA